MRIAEDTDLDISLYYEVLQIRTILGDRKRNADILFCLADVYRLRREYDEAMSLYSGVLEIRASLHDGKSPGRADALWGLAELHRHRSEYEKAILLYSEEVEIRTRHCDKKGTADALWGPMRVRRGHSTLLRGFGNTYRIWRPKGWSRRSLWSR